MLPGNWRQYGEYPTAVSLSRFNSIRRTCTQTHAQPPPLYDSFINTPDAILYMELLPIYKWDLISPPSNPRPLQNLHSPNYFSFSCTSLLWKISSFSCEFIYVRQRRVGKRNWAKVSIAEPLVSWLSSLDFNLRLVISHLTAGLQPAENSNKFSAFAELTTPYGNK
jgi:hypothetical protein